MNIKIDKDAFLPCRAYQLDAGYDLFSPYDFLLPPADDMGDGWKTVDVGVHFEIPEGYVGFIKSKSGLNINECITCDGTIDSGYTGSIKVKLYNHTNTWRKFKRGDKIAQIVFLPIYTPELITVDVLKETEGGNNGFGSTGR